MTASTGLDPTHRSNICATGIAKRQQPRTGVLPMRTINLETGIASGLVIKRQNNVQADDGED